MVPIDFLTGVPTRAMLQNSSDFSCLARPARDKNQIAKIAIEAFNRCVLLGI
jgi:hypothetical protein